MEELDLIIQDFEETCSTLAITHDSPCEEMIKEKFEEYHQAKLKLLGIADVSDTLILTPKDAELFFNEIMNPKDANEALKKAMLKFITR
jgi:hypothetical protein